MLGGLETRSFIEFRTVDDSTALERGRIDSVLGGIVSTDTLIKEDEDLEMGDVEELLVEEVSIDGLCGVY